MATAEKISPSLFFATPDGIADLVKELSVANDPTAAYRAHSKLVFESVQAAVDVGHWDYALTKLKAMVADDPMNGARHFYLASVSADAGDLATAAKELATAKKLDPTISLDKQPSLRMLALELHAPSSIPWHCKTKALEDDAIHNIPQLLGLGAGSATITSIENPLDDFKHPYAPGMMFLACQIRIHFSNGYFQGGYFEEIERPHGGVQIYFGSEIYDPPINGF